MDNKHDNAATQLIQNVLTLEGQEEENQEANGRPSASSSAPTGIKQQLIEHQVIEVLNTIYDPEIPVNIYELGLIYSLEVDPNGIVDIQMTLTSPACPVAGTLPGEVESKIREVPGVQDVRLELV